MTAERWRRNADCDGSVIHVYRGIDYADALERALALENHAVDARLLIGKGLAERAHRGAEQILLLQPREPVGSCVRGEALAQYRVQSRFVRHSEQVRCKARIGAKLRQLQCLADGS